MSSEIQIITDSATDVPKEFLEKHKIPVVPLTVMFGETEYRDNVDLSTEEFYNKLATEKAFPATNQVNPSQFVDVFSDYLNQGKTIIYVGLALRLSGTVQSARLAKEMLKSNEIHIFDTCSASVGAGLQVIRAAEMAEMGLTAPEILAQLEQNREESFGCFVLNSLDHLVRGGRLSRTQGIVGSVLNIKPILKFHNTGEIGVAEKVRSQKKAVQVIIERAKETKRDFSELTVAVAHTNNQELAEQLANQIEAELQPGRIIIGLVGPTVATHAGPGGVGLFF